MKRPRDLKSGGPAVQNNRLAISEQVCCGSADGLLGFSGFQCPKVIGRFLCSQKASNCASVNPAERATALKGLQVPPYRHL